MVVRNHEFITIFPFPSDVFRGYIPNILAWQEVNIAPIVWIGVENVYVAWVILRLCLPRLFEGPRFFHTPKGPRKDQL